MKKVEKEIRETLFSLKDEKYIEFSAKLIPTVEKKNIIGVRNPLVRNLAKEISKDEKKKYAYLSSLPHKYLEENNLHGFIIEREKDYDKTIELLNEFLPYVDNWATCDTCTPKSFKKHKKEVMPEIKKWVKSDHVYTIRFGIEMLMCYFLDEDFKKAHLNLVCKVHNEDYYVKMMCAWYFATALAKQWDETIPVIENKKLDKWVHNKTIQKAIESYRITDEQKAYLKTLKIK